MDNTLLLAMQAQMTLQRRMDATANNLANLNTSGFKADAVVIEEANNTDASAIEAPSDIRFNRDVTIMRDMRQGPIAMTGNPLDAAIEGEGFFMVQGDGGETLYTRDGAFSVNAAGQLVTSEGRAVLSSGGAPIVFDAQGESPAIGRDGTITIAGIEAGRLGLARFAAPGALEKVGENLWSAKDQGAAPFEGVVVQGAIEGSNVEAVLELTRLIEISRAYESASRIVAGADELRQRAIQELGQI